MSSHLSTLVLHRYRYGELPPAEIAAVDAHVAGCPRCRRRLDAQLAERAAFELEPVPPALRTPEPARRPSRWWAWLAAPLLAAGVGLAVLSVPEDPRAPVEDVRIKGAGDRLEVWVETDDGPRAVPDRGELSPGDRIQLRIRRPPAPWVTLAGDDATGAVEVYGTWRAQDTDAWQPAPFALGIDDTSDRQRFHAVFTEDRPTPVQVRKALSGEGDLTPALVETLSFRVR